MKILNLYSGIGGNRKLWGNEHKITAIENNPKIAKIYQDFFPKDKVIITDAHDYLLKHFEEFDFIWSSPPCPTHSRMNWLTNVQEGKKLKYPDMKLYEEILLLQYWFKGKYCIENVITYYEPLVKPQISNNHYFWTNFYIIPTPNTTRGILDRGGWIQERERRIGFDFSDINITKTLKRKIINNCVEPELGLHILNCAIRQPQKKLL